ncbi:MAG: winged helix-turn-helix domain-containing protein [Candidatus Onthomonas sp.]
MKQELHPKMTIRLYKQDKCFGPGIAALLSRVRELHSLRSAAQSMGMAYSKAWKILRQCEAELGFRLLFSTTGGKGGGGAVLTPEGERLLDAYERYCQAMEEYGQPLFRALFEPVLEEEEATPDSSL